jgi:hypothetical protein
MPEPYTGGGQETSTYQNVPEMPAQLLRLRKETKEQFGEDPNHAIILSATLPKSTTLLHTMTNKRLEKDIHTDQSQRRWIDREEGCLQQWCLPNKKKTMSASGQLRKGWQRFGEQIIANSPR